MRRGLAILLLTPCLLGLRDCGEQIFQSDLASSRAFGPASNGASCVHCHFGPGVAGRITVGGGGVRYRAPVYVRVGAGPVRPHFRFGDPRPIPSDAQVATRLAPPLGGPGEVDDIPDVFIRIRADPTDGDGDGISGRIGGLDADGRVLRFGQQAHVATLQEFIERALAEEHGSEAATSRDAWLALSRGEKLALSEFVRAL